MRRSLLYASAIKLATHKVPTTPSVLLSKIHPILVAFGPVYPTLSRKCRIAWPRRSLILVPLYADRRLSFSFLCIKVNVYWMGIAINQEYAINGKLGCQNETKRNETKGAWFRSYVGVYNVTRTFRPEILEIAVYFPSEGIELATLRVTPRPHPIIFLDGKSKVGALPVPAVPLDIRERKAGNGASARSSCHFHANVSLRFVSVRVQMRRRIRAFDSSLVVVACTCTFYVQKTATNGIARTRAPKIVDVRHPPVFAVSPSAKHNFAFAVAAGITAEDEAYFVEPVPSEKPRDLRSFGTPFRIVAAEPHRRDARILVPSHRFAMFLTASIFPLCPRQNYLLSTLLRSISRTATPVPPAYGNHNLSSNVYRFESKRSIGITRSCVAVASNFKRRYRCR